MVAFDVIDARAATFCLLVRLSLEMRRGGFGRSTGRGVRGAVKSTFMSSPSHKPTMHSPSAFG